jgi:hypothetical protein
MTTASVGGNPCTTEGIVVATTREKIEARLREQFEHQIDALVGRRLYQEREIMVEALEEAREREMAKFEEKLDREQEEAIAKWEENRAEDIEQELRDEFEAKLDDKIETVEQELTEAAVRSHRESRR